MARPRVLILRAPGTNCDVETAYAFDLAGGASQRVHVNRLLEDRRQLADYQILCLPGGFSYGDDLAAGRILGSQLRHHLADVLAEFKAAGKLILGICNGFQILLKSGLLLPADTHGERATLAWNQSGRFEDRWVWLQNAGGKAVFFAGIQTLYLPVAHAEGRFTTRDDATLAELARSGQVALRYCRAPGEGEQPPEYPDNPNGAQQDIAGICDPTGRVCGLMPHPERHVDPTHHPRWTRGELAEAGDGLRVFQNAVNYFR